MESSAYYLQRMNEYSQEAKKCRRVYEDYDSYKTKLEKAKIHLQNVSNFLKNADSAFRGGGYMCDGEPLDQGMLQDDFVLIDKKIDEVINLLLLTKRAMDVEMSSQETASKNYAIMKKNYEDALKLENQ